MLNRIRHFGALALALTLATSCSSEHAAPTTPQLAPTQESASLLGTVGNVVSDALSGLQLVRGISRTTPLAQDITISKTIDAAGGELSIPEAGVTVTIPEGALTSPTVVTMRARAGSLVAYDFEPHGITFAKPLVFRQSLEGTTASLLSGPFLRLGYYPDEKLLGQTTAVVTELIGGTVDVLTRTFTSRIEHFSGYMVACGRDAE